MLMELVNNAQIWHEMSWPFDKKKLNKPISKQYFSNDLKKPVDEEHFTC